MRRFKLFMSSMLAIMMLIGLVPSKYFEKEVKAEDGGYQTLLKEDTFLEDVIEFENKIFISYRDKSNNYISLIKEGKEIVLEKYDIDMYDFDIIQEKNILSIRVYGKDIVYDDYNDGKNIYRQFDFNTEKLSELNKDGYLKEKEKKDEGINSNNRYEKVKEKDTIESILEKINKKIETELTIKNKDLFESQEYNEVYKNYEEVLEINITKNLFNDVSFYISQYSLVSEESKSYSGLIIGQDIYVYGFKVDEEHSEFRIKSSSDTGTDIWLKLNGENDVFDLLKYDQGNLVSKGRIELENRLFEVHATEMSREDISIYYSQEGKSKLCIYTLKNEKYEKINEKLIITGFSFEDEDYHSHWVIENEIDNYYITLIDKMGISRKANITKELNRLSEISGKDIMEGDTNIYSPTVSVIAINKNNVIVRFMDGGFIVIQEGANTHQESGWRLIDGNWYYFDESGNKTKGWLDLNNKWYYLNDQGQMMTSWNKIGNAWYYLKASGEMATGWNNVGSSWYFMNNQGAMQTGWLNDKGTWYYLNGSGEMATGWNNVGSSWYFMNGQGAMQTGWLNDKGTWYYLNISGEMATGWKKVGSNWYLMNGEGQMMTGWNKIGNDWYYLKDSGGMVTGWQYIDSTWYWFNGQGVMA